jgi:UDP-glucose 4-epimerase
MRVFITGGLGFMGQSISEVLKNHDVTLYDTVIDNFRRKYFENVNFIQGDILNTEHLTSSMAEHDIVIHLAAYMNSSMDINHYIRGANVNINGTLNVIDAMKRNGINKLVFFSSSFVYGNIDGRNEEHSKNPHTGYGVTKIACERFLHGVDYVIVRPSIVCGKYDWYGQSISIFIKQAITTGEIKLFKGSENTVRDYVNSEDVAGFIRVIIDKKLFNNEVYNLSSGEGIKSIELANKIASVTNCSVSIVDKQSFTNLHILSLDNSKANQYYTFKKLDEYLPKYIEWAKNNHQEYWK